MSEREEASTSTRFQRHTTERKMSAITTVFNELRLDEELCDVVIKVNGTEFNADKDILCSCSPYFRALFSSVWNNSEKRVFNIPGVSPDMMGLIIQYAYTRSVPVTEENVEELLAAADQFNVMGLVQTCCEFLESQLCPENCIVIWRFADVYSCPDLKRRAYLYILHHFEEMADASEEFLELSLAQLCDIVEKDDLSVEQEDAVFEAILRWIGHQAEERGPFISVLLPKVRMALMTADYFMSNVKNNALVKDCDDCKPIIVNALEAMSDLNMNGPSNSDLCNPLARPRLHSSTLLAISNDLTAIEAYDARADRWVNLTKGGESEGSQGAAYLNGFVYCVGAFNRVDRVLNSMRKFNPVTRTWHQVAPMHSRRSFVSVAVLGGCIYAMGGWDGDVYLNTAERYEPEADQWTLIAPMDEPRGFASATTLQGKVYICCGSNGNERLFTAECYNPETNQWTLIAPMRSRCCGMGVIAYRGLVYAVGGFDGRGNVLRTAEAYNPVTNAWRSVPPMFKSREYFGIEVVDDLLFVVGGFDDCVECYNAKTDEWHRAHQAGPSLRHRVSVSCCAVPRLPKGWRDGPQTS